MKIWLDRKNSLFSIGAIADYIEKAKALYQEYKQRKKESKQEQSLENTNQKKRKKK